MERLTYDFCFNGVHCNQVKGADNLECSEVCEREGSCKERPIARAFDRLAAIEDILGDDYDLDRLRELIQADREGLVTRLLFKVGDKVYDISCGKIVEKQVISITFLLSRSQAHICYHAENARHAVTTIEPEDIGESIFPNLGEAEAAMAKAKEAAHEYTGK